ncbi:Protein N-acetyltransferase, RimJ/RimL family [Pedococcus dokdonensis]|uniref:Protein N-acetyltransferase, RimJ/RimL family n=1 Tax=Pedococcus dokdonensis TaxID=443156 RepID=A0A1H0TW93_9MICO|nr:GNAT family protein [Pedococcus dokdonensis]SDP58224.1 Protein N-acetyltransferase, RimJ/RimL family [Pedococcus dokdonensis]
MPKDLTHVDWPVSTARLTIRRATADDADAVLAYRTSPSVTEWMGIPPEDFRARFVAPERLDLLLVIERDGVFIGDLMVRIGDAWSPLRLTDQAEGVQAELGWGLRPEETGHGYATEAVEEVLRICFEDLGLRRVTAGCFADNVRSWRLMERLGMRREQHAVRDALHPSGEWRDGYGYALLAEEWAASRAGLGPPPA